MNLEAYKKAHGALALVDASALTGRIRATGTDVLDLLHRMSTNDLTPLFGKPGKGAQTILTTEKGRIVDLITVIATSDGALLVVSKDHEQKVIQWLDKFVIMEDAKFANATAEISQFILFGPSALEFLTTKSATDFIALENFSSVETEIDSIPVRIQKSNRIIESGFSIFCDAKDHDALLAMLEEEIAEFGGTVLDADTYETIRIEAGLPSAPNELNEKHNPLETALVQAVSFTKGCYIGQEVIARLDSYDKVQRHLMGVKFTSNLNGTTAPLALQASDGTEIGEITSLTFSPSLDASIGIALVKTAFANPNASVKSLGNDAVLTKLPFDTEAS
jgi:aminomethyltransferase